MKQTKKALVAYYDWRALTRLAVADFSAKTGTPFDKDTPLHFMTGNDGQDMPWIRIDLTPLKDQKAT